MNIINDDAAQTTTEMLLLFGGVIVIVVFAAFFYTNYLAGLGTIKNGTDLNNTLTGINNLTAKLE
jgi:hypothetical protein